MLKWMLRSDQNVCKNSRSRLDLAYLIKNKFITSRIRPKIEKQDRNQTLFLMTENVCRDRIQLSLEFDLGKISIVILEYLELVFCYILNIIRKIQVRSNFVNQKICKSLNFKCTFKVSNIKLTFKNSDNTKENLRNILAQQFAILPQGSASVKGRMATRFCHSNYFLSPKTTSNFSLFFHFLSLPCLL